MGFEKFQTEERLPPFFPFLRFSLKELRPEPGSLLALFAAKELGQMKEMFFNGGRVTDPDLAAFRLRGLFFRRRVPFLRVRVIAVRVSHFQTFFLLKHST
jgi:hypothetical protein